MSRTIASRAPSLPLVDGLFIAALAAHIPVGIEYARRMWKVGHYQFFPLLMAVAAWLIYSRVSKITPATERSNLTFGLLALNVFILASAVALFSPFLWIISFLLLIGVFVYDRWGKRGMIAALPAWLLFIFAVPLPGNLDLKLINQMQFMASQLASWVLDAFGQLHFREGVILVTEKKQFFTEEACSGIRSLFSSLAAIAIYGVMQSYPVWRHVFNLIQTVIWVVVGNALRIAIVVYVADNWTEEIAAGTAHELLGLGVFLFIFALAMSTDRALNAWSSERINTSTDDVLMDGVEEPTIEGTTTTTGNRTNSSPAIRWTFIGMFAVIALLALRLTWAKISAGEYLFQFDETDLIVSLETDLPKSIDGWELTEFEHQMRDDTRLLAPESYIWTYSKNGRKVKISLDSPYYDFHNLNDCYAGFGWDVDFKHQYKIKDANAKDMTVLNMQKKNENGIVYFSAYDRVGNIAIPQKDTNYAPSTIEKVTRNVRLALGALSQENDPRMSKQPLPISQVQLQYQTPGELSDLADIENLFLKAREILRKTDRFQQTSN